MLIIYCIVDTILIIKNSFNNKNTVIRKTIGIDPNLVKAKPSIYFMLFDGYPGYTSLSDSFSFKNDSLYSFLKQNNFKVESSFSNYNLTYYCMASIFNLNYVKNTGYNEITMTDLKQRYDDIKNADLFNILDSLGYSVKNYSLFDLKNNPGVGYSFSLNIGTTKLLTDKMLHSRFIKNIGWVFITGKYSIPFIKNRYKDASNQYNKKVEDSLTNCLVERNTKPKFVYMHFIMPHWPYYYDKNGVLDKTASLYDETPNSNKNKFIGYLKYTNTKMVQCVNKILLQDSNAVIITMSDHGFREYTGIETNKSNAVFDNFCAIRFSGNNNHLKKDSLSNVNIFRYLLNTEFNQKMTFLPDSSFYLEFKKSVEKIKE